MTVIFGGLRGATLQVVATAAVVAVINLGGLGRHLIDGLALEDGTMSLIAECTGALVVGVDPDTELVDALPVGLAILGPSDAENKDVLVFTRATAEKYQLESKHPRPRQGLRPAYPRRTG